MAVYRPSLLVRLPLHFLSVMLLFVVLLLVGVGIFFERLGEPLPWSLLLGGGGVCLFFVALNTIVAAMRLCVVDDRAALRVGPWRREVRLPGAEVVVEHSPVGIAGVRVRSAGGGKPLRLVPAWFVDFDGALREIERAAVAGGGRVEHRSQ